MAFASAQPRPAAVVRGAAGRRAARLLPPTRWPRVPAHGGPARPRATDADLEAAMEEFLQKQAAREAGSGDAPLPTTGATPGGAVVGADIVPDDEAKRLCREVVDAVQRLRAGRDMTVNEIRLTLAIESPIVREQREFMGIETGSGVSRDDIAAALGDITAGRIPADRLALKELHREMMEWPFITAPAAGGGAGGASKYEPERTGGAAGWRRGQARPVPMGRDASETPQTLADRLPDWMGYGFLYFVSVIPVIIAGSVVAVLFFNSLK